MWKFSFVFSFFFWFAGTIISLLLFHLLFFLTHFWDLLFNALFAVALTYFSIYAIAFAHTHLDLYFMTSSLKSLLYCSYSSLNSIYTVCSSNTSVWVIIIYYLKSGEDIKFLVPILIHIVFILHVEKERIRDENGEKGKRSALQDSWWSKGSFFKGMDRISYFQ